jgi:hypothetical protein
VIDSRTAAGKKTVVKKTAVVSKPANFKKANFNMAINVPESAIQKLRAGKTKSNNVKTYKGTKSAVMKEAMNRFYGKGWDGSAGSGKMKDAPIGPKSTAPKGGGKPKAKGDAPIGPKSVKPKSIKPASPKGNERTKSRTVKTSTTRSNVNQPGKVWRSKTYGPRYMGD